MAEEESKPKNLNYINLKLCFKLNQKKETVDKK